MPAPVAGFFRNLADECLLTRLRIAAGAAAGLPDRGHRCRPAHPADAVAHPVPAVFVTLTPLLKNHPNADGFDPAFTHLLA